MYLQKYIKKTRGSSEGSTNRFREWLKRDMNLSVHIWNPRKGFVLEEDLKDVSIEGKLYSEDASYVLTVNPSFVRALCPFREKRMTEQLVRDNSGKFLIVIEGIDPHSLGFSE